MKRPVSHILWAWPPDAGPRTAASLVVHVRGPERLETEVQTLKARGLKVMVAPRAIGESEYWA